MLLSIGRNTSNQYKYLGVNISSTGKSLVAEKTLGLKASRALFFNKAKSF